jgi:hypothetical protein
MKFQLTALARIAIGLMQGVALYLLQQAFEAKTWPATDGLTFAPLIVVAVFVPTIVVAGLGNMRARTLAAWTAVAIAVCAGLAIYNIFRDLTGGTAIQRVTPTATLWLCLGAGLFIAHALIASGDADRKFIASYSRYFDMSWAQGVQLALAVCFVALFWAMLELGAELFRLIKIELLADLIKRSWFWIPMTALAFTYALHMTDMRGRSCPRDTHAVAEPVVLASAGNDTYHSRLLIDAAIYRPGAALEHTARHGHIAGGICGIGISDQ